ncbi:NAD(P)H-hydrate dehydratase [Candidatus Omnitrophota bacterium]
MSYKKLKKEFTEIFPSRLLDSHKGDYGKILFISGSRGMTGAAYLASSAALRCGAGLVTLAIPESLNAIMEVKLTEVMTLPISDDGKGFLSIDRIDEINKGVQDKDAIAIGPGLGQNESTFLLVRELCAGIKQPLVLDADGLNAFVKNTASLSALPAEVIITPHEGEFVRLFGLINGSREECALLVAREYNVVVVLKGARTVVASPQGDVYTNTSGNPGMATGGTGDCLTGMITAFLGLKLSLFHAAKFAVLLHGCAGDIACNEYGEVSMSATDLLQSIPKAILRFTK